MQSLRVTTQKKINGLEKYSEFNELQTAINNMLDQIHSYHDNILEQRLLLKDSEIKTLQSQLNPHFLFNVLNTLTWKAEMTDNSEISQMVIAIGEIPESLDDLQNLNHDTVRGRTSFCILL